MPLLVERPLDRRLICGSFMLHTVGRLAGVPCLRNLYRCRPIPAPLLSTQASGMSKQLEKTDFGPDGFKWLTLKRIVVSPHDADLLDPELWLRTQLLHAYHPSFVACSTKILAAGVLTIYIISWYDSRTPHSLIYQEALVGVCRKNDPCRVRL